MSNVMVGVCPYCGIKFVKTANRQAYCSDECRNKARAEQNRRKSNKYYRKKHTKSLDLVCFDKDNEEYLRRLNDVFNDMLIMINRGELEKEQTNNFINGMKNDLNGIILIAYKYIKDNKRSVL